MTLAFVGDGVFELMVRERLLQRGSMPANALHRLAVEKVNATAQASAYERVEAVLNEDERSILMRGRNANTAKVPKSCTPAEYRKATAIEALFGYLYLSRDMDRLGELFLLIDETIAAARED